MILRCAVLALFSVLVQSRAGAQQTLLFEITKAENEKSSWLYGTIHMNDSAFLSCESFFSDLISKCEVFSGEVDMMSIEPSMSMFGRMALNGQTLEDFYDADEFKEVMHHLRQKMGPFAEGMMGLKPFWVAAMIGPEPDSNEASALEDVVDYRLQLIARQEMLAMHPLESIDEQLDAVDQIPLEAQAGMLLETIREENQDGSLELMRSYYSRGNLDSLEAFYLENALVKEAELALIELRNKTMYTRLSALLENGVSVFCAVGALHLVGETGLIQALRADGYTVTDVHYLPCD